MATRLLTPNQAVRRMLRKIFKKQIEENTHQCKDPLLDQKILRGIGNAYADAVLWDAGISRFSESNKIRDDKIKSLAKSIKIMLQVQRSRFSNPIPILSREKSGTFWSSITPKDKSNRFRHSYQSRRIRKDLLYQQAEII